MHGGSRRPSASSPNLPSAAALIACLAGCQDGTQLLVTVESDQALTAVNARVRPADRVSGDQEHAFEVAEHGLPFSFGIAPPDGDAERRVFVAVDGIEPGQAPISQRVILPFIEGRVARFTVSLAGACRTVTCGMNQTCADGACRPQEVQPGELDRSPPVDGPDAGPNKPETDAGPIDGEPLVATPNFVNFNESLMNPRRPDIYVGQHVEVAIDLRNTSQVTLTGLTVRVVDDATAAVSIVTPPPASLIADQAETIRVRFVPPGPQTYTSSLEIGYTGADPQRIPLRGQAVTCPAPAGTTAQATPDGICRLDCAEGWADADGDPETGCECAIVSDIDAPDPEFIDANCDGIDGDAARAIFVSTMGADANPGTRSLPLRSIGVAVDRLSSDRPEIYIASGIYRESIVISRAALIYGGYDNQWTRGSSGPSIFGSAQAVLIRSGTAAVTLNTLAISAADATGAGESSIAVTIESSQDVTLANLQLEAGAGAAGQSMDRSATGERGQPGSPGLVGCSNCNGQDAAGNGGPGGIGSCGNDGEAGGRAGYGGYDQFELARPERPNGEQGCSRGWGGFTAVDCANCPQINNCGYEPAQTGCPGAPGDPGEAGQDGVGATNGLGQIESGRWTAAPGRRAEPGFTGEPGGGGGGGGGGGDQCVDFYDPFEGICIIVDGNCVGDRGGGGGGGGSGGCGGVAGEGGGGGGGSFALMAIESQVDITQSTFTSGRGGPGGRGGAGGQGGLGGEGGLGGLPQGLAGDESQAGGPGGLGGQGGPGGGGGGGAGGASACIVVQEGTLAVDTLNTTNCVLGEAGAGGAGGGADNSGVAGAERALLEL